VMKHVTGLLLVLALSACQANEHRAFDMPDRTDDRPFSHGYVAGDTVYVSGTLGIDPATGEIPVSVEDEVRFAMDTIAARLGQVDLTMADVVQVQVFCPDLTLYGTFNDVYRTYFDGDYPARAFVGSGPLLAGARFEICATAHR